MSRRLYEAINSHNPAGVIALADPEAVFSDMAFSVEWRGHAGIEEMLLTSAEMLPDYSFEISSLYESSERYVVEWRMRGTFAKTGQPIEVAGASVGDLRDGRIVGNRDYWNYASLRKQAGLG